MKYKNSYLLGKIVVLLLLWPVCVMAGSSKPSFDCDKTQTTIEKAICADAELSDLDNRLEDAYSEMNRWAFIGEASEKATFKQEQSEWIRQRNTKCKGLSLQETGACIKPLYEKRVADLEGRIKKVRASADKRSAERVDNTYYALVMSKNDNVCQHMLSIYNEDLKQNGRLILDNHQEYNSIKWDKNTQIMQGRYLYSRRMQDAKISVFDINNDAQSEVVLFSRTYPTYSMAAMDFFYYFSHALYKKIKTEIEIRELVKHNIGDSLWGKDGGPYILKDLPAQRIVYFEGKARPDWDSNYICISPYMYIRPFVYEGSSYVSVIGADYDVPFDETNLISIRKYKPDNTLEDVCYYVKTQIIDRIPQPEPPKNGGQQ